MKFPWISLQNEHTLQGHAVGKSNPREHRGVREGKKHQHFQSNPVLPQVLRETTANTADSSLTPKTYQPLDTSLAGQEQTASIHGTHTNSVPLASKVK